MDCEQAQQLICARLDGQLPESRACAELEAHLDSCVECRAVAADWAAQDQSIRTAIASHRRRSAELAERSAVRFGRRQSVARARQLALMLLSAAAGFSAGLFWLRAPAPPLRFGEARPTAHLTLATGLVEVRPEAGDWSPLSTGGDVRAGTWIRTAPGSRCEFRLADGSEIRLNSATEVRLVTTRRVELVRGQVWTRAGAGTVPYELIVRDTRIVGGSMTFDVLAELASIQLTVMHGVARVRAGPTERSVAAGQQLAVEDGRAGEPAQVDNLVAATRWLHELLMLKGRGDPELATRIDDLFAQIGETKMAYVYEQDIRALGDHCVLPLVRYIESDRSQTSSPKRAQAARIVSDVAQPWCIPELITLLGDADGEVRYHAARALTRLTGESFGRDPSSWRDSPSEACEPTVGNWHAWWEANRERFPGAAATPVRALP